ncbi:hypothetical protein TNCT_317731 [Trichonephila clavata]|uniref:U11/U12 small nuclear ribonucleoprotein 35 kDa protein n=1 Tax=Trichonephila clavata TaxID=2740835 RepID=A0A8X6GRZ3_TRICU|nr:hypothetical protein TNCT_317731 [Trichonephila clavata]
MLWFLKDSTMSSFKWEPVPRTYDPLKAGSIDGTDMIPHDHGIVRAMQAEYKPNNLVVGDPKATIFVGRLNPITEEDALKKVFSRFGDIKRLRLIRDIVTGFSKGYAFIEYYDKYDAARAVRDADVVIDDKEVLVDSECERLLKGWIPRRLGGGFSGKKESGQLRFGCKERPFKKPILPHKSEKEHPYSNSYSDRYHSKNKFSDRHGSHRRSKHYD